MPLKYNPVTNRFEQQPATNAGTDNPPQGTQAGDYYIDQVTGQKKQKSYNPVAGVPDQVISTTVVPKQARAVAPSPTPDMAPPKVSTKAKTAPVKPVGGKKVGPNETIKTTTAPKPSGIVGGLTPQSQAQLVTDAISQLLTDPNALGSGGLAGLIAALEPSGGTGSGSDAAAAKIAAQKAAGKRIISTAKNAQEQYNTLGEQTYQDILKRSGDYYTKQKNQAVTNIDTATTDFLKNLIAPTAYGNTPIAQLTPEQQGLMGSLQAYGATGGKAAQQMSEDTASNKFIADLMRTSTQGLQGAETDYFNALRNAATGAQTAAKQNLEGILANYQGQAQSDADKLKRDYIFKGLQELISGQTNAANLLG